MAVNMAQIRDTKWLTLEVCREFQRGTCSRPDTECKFAHPAKSCQVENGRIIACFDSLKGDDSRYRNAALFLNGRLPTVPGMNCPTIQYEARSSCCTVPSPVEREIVDSDSFALCHNSLALKLLIGRCSRENCKYLHPPQHLKTQLEINGRNNLIQQKNMAMLAQQMQLANAMMPSTQLQPMPMFSVAPNLATNAAAAFNPYMGPVSPGLLPAEMMPTGPMLVTGNPAVPGPAAAAAAAQKLMRTDRLEVCREYQRGNCTRGETDCRFAHPSDSTMIDTNDNTVTVCMDYIKGRCSREKLRKAWYSILSPSK
ncbi:UNVERIFIED_CONTAM: hypothetical protein FKN15_044519 [Acipenser sinensis]